MSSVYDPFLNVAREREQMASQRDFLAQIRAGGHLMGPDLFGVVGRYTRDVAKIYWDYARELRDRAIASFGFSLVFSALACAVGARTWASIERHGEPPALVLIFLYAMYGVGLGLSASFVQTMFRCRRDYRKADLIASEWELVGLEAEGSANAANHAPR
jgi:hypothetical protein